jgi:HlyD family secretion protein
MPWSLDVEASRVNDGTVSASLAQHATASLLFGQGRRTLCATGARFVREGIVSAQDAASLPPGIPGALPQKVAPRPFRARMGRILGWLKLLPLVVIVGLVVYQRLVARVAVHQHAVEYGDVVREVFGRATIESRREVQLGFDLVGRISDVLVDEGDRVKLGQVVAHLGPEQLKAEVHAASSGVSLARAALARLAADERRALATLTYAEQEAARIRKLAASGAVSSRDLDLAEQQLALTQADLDRVRAARNEAMNQIAVASGTAETMVTTVTRAVLVSPFDGVVIRRFKDPGDTVTVGSTVLRIVAVDRLWARAAVDESTLGDLREGMRAEVALLGEAGSPLQGTVDRIGREVDRQTHEVLVDVLLEQPPAQLAIGHRADVHIAIERRSNVTRIPLAFVQRDSAGTFAFVDRSQRIARAPLQLGVIGRAFAEITSGVSDGDVVLGAPAPGAALALGRRWVAAP